MNAVILFALMLGILTYTFSAIWFLKAGEFKPKGPQWLRTTVWIIYGALNYIIPNLWLNDVITMVILSAYYLLIGWIFYHRSRNWLLYQMIFYAVTYAAQLIAISAVIWAERWISMELVVRSCSIQLLKCLCIVIATAGLRVLVQKRGVFDRKNLKIKGMLLVPVLSFILIFMYLSAGDVFFIRYGYEWIILYCVLFLFLNGYCIYVWYEVAANRELKHRLALMEQQNELTHQYYEEMEKNYNRSRKIIHDIRNHLHVLEESAKMDDSQYFQDVHNMLNSLGMKFYSDNRMLNIILNDKFRRLSPNQVECNLGGINFDEISDMDLTTIFANLLDNAIEEGERKEDFWLKLRGEQIQDFTVVKIWNPSKMQYEPGHSQKKGHEGIGLSNVRHAVERYNGEIKIEYKENIFSVTLVFPG